MVKRLVFLAGLCFFSVWLWQVTYCPFNDGQQLRLFSQAAKPKKILLIPLDSRPPCRQWVVDFGKIVGAEVILPPSALLDYYSQPGEIERLKVYLTKNIAECDAVILSIDQLLCGGLLAAREKPPDEDQVRAMLDFLQTLHNKAPAVPIYAFGVLPRLQPPDNMGSWQGRRKLVEYSRLIGRKEAGVEIDEQEFADVCASLSTELTEKYRRRFTDNAALNRKLATLVQSGVITELVLGQDDGEPYGIPNIELNKLKEYLSRQRIDGRIIITHGADELAVMMLARLLGAGDSLKVYVHYADETTGMRIMPYMAINMRETVAEKLSFLRAKLSDTPEKADFILVVNAASDAGGRLSTAKVVEDYIVAGHFVALVDLSEHFREEETIMPLLIRRAAPINALIAYAGWNTASNSVGTALAQGAIFVSRQKKADDSMTAMNLYAQNIRVLHNRIVEDNFYLKSAIDAVNGDLRKAGFVNVADLDLQRNYRFAMFGLQKSLASRTASYAASRAFRRPFAVKWQTGSNELRAQDLTFDAYFPWPRTFEIHLETQVSLRKR